MWLCDMSCAVAFIKHANAAMANTQIVVSNFRNMELVRRNSAFIVRAPLFRVLSVGKMVNTTSRATLRSQNLRGFCLDKKSDAADLSQRHRLRLPLGAGTERLGN